MAIAADMEAMIDDMDPLLLRIMAVGLHDRNTLVKALTSMMCCDCFFRHAGAASAMLVVTERQLAERASMAADSVQMAAASVHVAADRDALAACGRGSGSGWPGVPGT